jgi:hypothetical protein
MPLFTSASGRPGKHGGARGQTQTCEYPYNHSALLDGGGEFVFCQKILH